MITIRSVSACGEREKVFLLESLFHGWRFEVGQTVVTTRYARWSIGEGKKGKIVGFSRPSCEGRTSEVLKVLLDGEKEPRNLRTREVEAISAK